MNCQELRQAVRLKTDDVNVIWENGPIRSMLEAGQEVREPLRGGFTNPELREAAEIFVGIRLALRDTAETVRRALRKAMTLYVPSRSCCRPTYSIKWPSDDEAEA